MNKLPSNLVDFAFNLLQEKIINSTYPAGQRLNISSLAKEYTISTIPVREALAKLHTIGLVTFIPNHGYRVSDHLNIKEFTDLFETRLMLDLAAVPGVLLNATDADLKELKSLNKKMSGKTYKTKRYQQFQTFMTLNAKFHRKFIDIANNEFLKKLYDKLNMEMFISRHIININFDFFELIHAHDDIVNSLELRDSDALRKSLINHISESLNQIFEYKEDIKLNIFH